MVKAAVKLSCHDNVHTPENMLRMSLSTVYLKQSLLLSYLVTPEEALVGLTLIRALNLGQSLNGGLRSLLILEEKKKEQHWWK